MTSPLLPYANSYLAITANSAPTMENGRIMQTPGNQYLVRCYLTRQDSSGTTTGADYLPTQNSPGNTLPGVSGQVYLYRGYALRWIAATDYEPGDEPSDGDNRWQQLSPATKPPWLIEGSKALHIQGLETPKNATVERCSGRYGGNAIDAIISREIKGIPVVVRSGDLTG